MHTVDDFCNSVLGKLDQWMTLSHSAEEFDCNYTVRRDDYTVRRVGVMNRINAFRAVLQFNSGKLRRTESKYACHNY